MLMKFKVIAFDCDGTLTNIQTGEFVESARVAIEKLRKKGYIVVLSTGRPVHSTKHVAEAGFFFDYTVASNGHLIADEKGRTLHQELFDRDLYEEISEYCQQHELGLFWKFESGSYIYTNHPNMKKVFQDLTAFHYERYPDPDILPNAGALVGYEKDRAKFMERFNGRVECVDGGVLLYDINKLGVSKKNGLEYLLKTLNVRPEEMLAFGDSENDIEMMRFAGYSVALGDGMESCRQAADHVTDAAAEDGILKALQHLNIL